MEVVTPQGSPGIYGAVLACLDPLWIYSPASIAGFMDAVGMITLINARTNASDKRKRQALRVAMGRRSSQIELKPKANILQYRGRWYSGWFGWNWQAHDNPEQAYAAQDAFLRPLWRRLKANGFYTLADLQAIWDTLALPPPPRSYQKEPKAEERWRNVRKIQLAIILVRYAQHRGLDVRKAHHRDIWLAKAPDHDWPLTVIKDVFRLLDRSRTYTPLDVLALVKKMAPNMMPHKIISEQNWHRYHIALFHVARDNGFPEQGDALITVGNAAPMPAWTGLRWRVSLLGTDELHK